MRELTNQTEKKPLGLPFGGTFATTESLDFHIENDLHYGKFYLSGFKKGQGLTVANALRRILLYDIRGVGISHVKFSQKNSLKMYHEFSSISGVRESILEIGLNMRSIIWGRLETETFDRLAFAKQKTRPEGEDKKPNSLRAASPPEPLVSLESFSEPSDQQIKAHISFEHILTTEGFLDSVSAKTQTDQSVFILKAKHLSIPKNSGLFIVNPDHYLATISLPWTHESLQGDADSDGKTGRNELLNITLEYIISVENSEENMKRAGNSLRAASPPEPLLRSRVPTGPLVSLESPSEPGNIKNSNVSLGGEAAPSNSENSGFDLGPFLPTDGSFFPVKKVNYSIQTSYETSGILLKTELPKNQIRISDFETNKNVIPEKQNVNRRSEEEVFLEIWTNGSISPQQALLEGFDFFIELFQNLRFSLNSGKE